mmetsp:Transcript_16512/g.35686  ORF Transcript_16512/g.35686 Transcript_16512/m.35686 type:complete len:206 (+) Transcript_16512:741-1358(+)
MSEIKCLLVVTGWIAGFSTCYIDGDNREYIVVVWLLQFCLFAARKSVYCIVLSSIIIISRQAVIALSTFTSMATALSLTPQIIHSSDQSHTGQAEYSVWILSLVNLPKRLIIWAKDWKEESHCTYYYSIIMGWRLWIVRVCSFRKCFQFFDRFFAVIVAVFVVVVVNLNFTTQPIQLVCLTSSTFQPPIHGANHLFNRKFSRNGM